jgi:hypothetical protein
MPSPIVNNVPISSIYENHFRNFYLVNRDYQRKLVWEVREKAKFIDSLLKQFPVPLVLLSKIRSDGNRLEIVDGLQRLESIIAFLESRFQVRGKYFDLRRDPRTKQLYEDGKLEQRKPLLDEESCIRLLKYELPMSVFEVETSSDVTRVFQRINSYGRRLSRQELRFSSSTASFAKLISKLAMDTRGDVSPTVIPISDMCKYSIGSHHLEYGIRAENIPWCRMGILMHSDIRESRDEELIGQIVSYTLLGRAAAPSGTTLDRIYGMSRKGRTDDIYARAKDELEKIGIDMAESQFVYVFDEVRKVILASREKDFKSLMFRRKPRRVKWHYQVVFLAFHELLIGNQTRIDDYQRLADSIRYYGDNSVVKNDWTGDIRFAAKEELKGRIREHFVDRGVHDPAIHSNHTKLEALLSSSRSEQETYDFKIGLHRLDGSNEFDADALNKVIRTLAAMANNGPKRIGRVIIGVADSEEDAKCWKDRCEEDYFEVAGHFIVGIEREATFQGGIDKYRELIKNKIEACGIKPASVKTCIRIESWKYRGKEVLVIQIDNVQDATFIDDEMWIRQDSRNKKLKQEEYKTVYSRFIG